MPQNDINPEIEEGLSALIQLTNSVGKAASPETQDALEKNMIKVIDLINTPEISEEEQAIAIITCLDAVNTLQKADKNSSFLSNLFLRFGDPSGTEKKLRKAKKILKTQGESGVKELITKLRWQAAKTKSYLESARISLLEQKIQKLLNQKS